MTSNLSLSLSNSFKELLQTDLTRVFGVDFPVDLVNSHTHTSSSKKPRDRVYTQSDTLFTMLLTSVQEDKSLQSSVNLFKQIFEERGLQLREKEKTLLEEERQADEKRPPRANVIKLRFILLFCK